VTNYASLFSVTNTPQTQPIPGSTQVPNAGGGYAWAVDDWQRLDRFLILGSEGGSYYAKEAELTKQNMEAVLRCIKTDGTRVVNRIVEISDAGRAHKNDPALFALAACAKLGDLPTRELANKMLPKVARISTHLFHYMDFVKAFGGRGTGVTRAIRRWYTAKSVPEICYQVVKYQQRDGWSHGNILQLVHPKPTSSEMNAALRWAVKGAEKGPLSLDVVPEPLRLIWAFEEMKRTTDVQTVIKLIREFRLTHEMVMNEWKSQPAVWEALLETMKPFAMIRNLGKMTKVGLLTGMSDATSTVVKRLTDRALLKKERVHPLALLLALGTYGEGHGDKGKLSWEPVGKICDALDAGFYEAFGAVAPMGKKLCLALDVSASMTWPQATIAGKIRAREASAAMALVTANVEEQYEIVAFSNGIERVAISPRQRLDDVKRSIERLPACSTDCAQPMMWALHHKIPVDCFVIYTDNETNAVSKHPVQALQEYRQKMGIAAKLVVVGMTSGGFSIADPNDGGMLDVVGFDTSVPNVISNFVLG
jgi:60 kDa SS-A/Ro ribonucleoprotein